MMKRPWKALLIRTTVWLAAEVMLSIIGLDDLADYSEYLFEGRHTNVAEWAVSFHTPVA